MQVCFGHCYEDLSLPYLPFFESLLPQLEQAPPEIRPALGDSLETIRHLLNRVGGTAAHPSVSSQPDYDKLQLFVAVGQASVKLAQSRPMLNTVGNLGVDADDLVAFDIGPDNEALAAIRPLGSPFSRLYFIDLPSGRAIDLGRIGKGEFIVGLGIQLGPQCGGR